MPDPTTTVATSTPLHTNSVACYVSAPQHPCHTAHTRRKVARPHHHRRHTQRSRNTPLDTWRGRRRNGTCDARRTRRCRRAGRCQRSTRGIQATPLLWRSIHRENHRRLAKSKPSPSMYRANYISKGLSWRMLMDGRPSKGCAAHGKAWKILEDCGRHWRVLDSWFVPGY